MTAASSEAASPAPQHQHQDIALLEAGGVQDGGAISVAVNPVALVVTECITVTSAMRKHARWAHSSVTAILGASSHKTPMIPKRDRGGQGVISAGEHDEAVQSRWGLRGKKGKSMQDNPLMAAFARLRSDLKGCKGMDIYVQLLGGGVATATGSTTFSYPFANAQAA